VALPTLSPEDREKALAKAAEARKARALVKEQLKKGQRTLQGTIAEADNSDIIGKMKVTALLESLPGVGKVRAGQVMEKLGISETRRVGGLGPKQRENLIEEFKD
jgi:hypothetical protein